MSHERARTEPVRRRGWVRRHPFWTAALTLPLVAMVAVAAVIAWWVSSLVPHAPGASDLSKVRPEYPAVIVSSDGQELAVLRKANREWVRLSQVSPHVVDALLATEDQRFYQHHGLDWRRTASAAWQTLHGRTQGGSTITQQLARNLFPDEIGRAPTLERKVKEAVTALRIEQVYGKEQILEIYLNTVPFLYNTYGIEMAARTYFDKPARELDVLQSATLVGMLKGTTYYNPVLNPARATQRRNIVLGQMARAGKLPMTELAMLQRRPLQLDFEVQAEQPGPAPHFVAVVRRWLIDWADRTGHDLYTEGLVVRTTLDSRAQRMAGEAVEQQAERLQKLADTQFAGRQGWGSRPELVDAFIRESAPYREAVAAGAPAAEVLARLHRDAAFMKSLREDKTRLQAGFVAIEPGTGYVRAWVGSRDFGLDQFDHVQQARRQPGSTFKPFVYGAAFDLGAKPTDVLVDQAVEIQLSPGEVWRPADGGAPSGQPLTLREALARSKNTITAQVVQRIGPAPVARLAKALGVRDSRLQEVPSLALGTSPVTLREMVSAYAAIANSGSYVAPTLVLEVKDRSGRVLESFQPAPAEGALAPYTDLVLLDAMRAVIDQGTGAAIRTRHGLQGDLAGKTGTTQDNTDGWFILAHPQLVAGAWVGFNDSRLTMADSWGQGAKSALPMVGDFFQQVTRARLVDAKARFPRAPDPLPYDVAGPSLFPPPLRPLESAVVVSSPPLPHPMSVSDTPPLGERDVTPVTVAPPLPAPVRPVERAIVVSPARVPELSAHPPRTPEPPWSSGVPRAVVVAPPRDGTASVPPGQASGAGPAPAPVGGIGGARRDSFAY